MDELQALNKLQNGSDVRGVALPTPDGGPVTLSVQTACRIARGFVRWLAARAGKPAAALRLAVGHDSRLSAQSLKEAVISGFAAEGAIAVQDCGLASTPAMFMGCVFDDTQFDGSVMITASHLPMNRNGLKFFTKSGGTEKSDVTKILALASGAGAVPPGAAGAPCALMDLYAAALRHKITAGVDGGGKPLQGLHVVVDAGNGAGGFFVHKVLLPLGANCEGSQFLQPDGRFPNHQPNPENAEAMDSICKAVISSGADLGIIFDTDVDRMSAVLPGGRQVNRNAIIALMSAVLAPEYPGGTIVTDSVTSDWLTEFLESKLGLRHHCFKRGYRNVINECRRLNAEGTCSPLAIETSGHGALKENYYLDDGAYLAVRLITAAAKMRRAGQTLADLLNGYREAAYAYEGRIGVAGEDCADYGRETLAAFERAAKAEGVRIARSCEGVRLGFENKGWMLLRQSLHDPVLPLNAEGESEAAVRAMLAQAKRWLDGFGRLDLSAL